MRIKGLLLATFSMIGISGAIAQGIEHDDMYFTSEDRAKLKAQRGTEIASNRPVKSKKFDYYQEESTNPTDSYSARNVNPEYTSRAHTRSAQADEQDYFVNNYQYNRNQLNNWNNNFNNWYGSSWYRPNFYGPGINTWNSPYYGYNSWNSPWYDPYWAYNGWSSSFSFHYGPSWNYGWGGNYNFWNRPYFGWDPYGMAYGYGMGYAGMGYGGGYWNNYRYPTTVVVVNRGEAGQGVVYGKRPTRGTTIVSSGNNVRSRSAVNSSVRDDNSSGRVSTPTQSRKQADYYNRAQRSTNSAQDSRSNTQYNRSRSWDNSSWDSNNSYNNNRSIDRSSSPSYSPSRSSSTGSGTRTSSGSTGSGRGRD